MNIVIIDDIVTTGSTMRECIKELYAHGASQIFIVALAINQIQGTYWSVDTAQVSCPNCSKKMQLLVNSHTRDFFYFCHNCKQTLSFDYGRTILCDYVNSEWFAS